MERIKIINQRLIDRFLDFIKSLSGRDNIAIYHDTDPDGICSGTLMFKALNRMGLNVDVFEGFDHGDPDMVDDVLMKMEESNINVIIFLDLLADRYPDTIKKLERHARVVIIDHHPIENDVSSDRTIFIKPQIFAKDIVPSRYCTTKLVYDFMSRLVDLSDLDWLCAVGIIGDFAFDSWEDYLDRLYDKYNIEKKDDHIDSRFGKVVKLLSGAGTISFEEVEKAALKIVESSALDEAIDSLKEYEKVESEIRKTVENYRDFAEKYPEKDLLIVYVSSPYYINSIVATRISLKMPEKVLLVVQEDKSSSDRIAASARCQSKRIDTGRLLRDAIEGFEEASAGGHIPAAGANIRKSDYEVFKRRIIELVKKEEYKNGR